MADSTWANRERPHSRKRWIWITCCSILFVIVIIVVVVPSVVVTREKKDNNSLQQNNNNNNENNNTTSENEDDPSTTNELTEPPPSYAKAVSSYSNLTRVRTYYNLDKKDRIFIIGDIHGCADEFKQLVQKIQYNPNRDQIILAGDLVYRGPDNVGVIRYAQEIGALCVRGNHDDITIRFKTYELHHGLHAMQDRNATMPEGDVKDPLQFGDDHMDIVKNMTQEDYNYLANCPMVIDLPTLNNSRVVHGGLDPAIEKPVDNDPYWVVNIRNMDDGDPERTKSDGKHWTKYWSKAQHEPNNTTPINIYYGHDAGRGLDLESETFGTDSGCVYGNQLTALEMKTHQITQVDCLKHSK